MLFNYITNIKKVKSKDVYVKYEQLYFPEMSGMYGKFPT